MSDAENRRVVARVDTGVILAVADASDADHDRCDELLAANPAALVAPTPVIVEVSWLIEDPKHRQPVLTASPCSKRPRKMLKLTIPILVALHSRQLAFRRHSPA